MARERKDRPVAVAVRSKLCRVNALRDFLQLLSAARGEGGTVRQLERGTGSKSRERGRQGVVSAREEGRSAGDRRRS